MIGLVNKILFCPLNTGKILVIYTFNNILKVLFHTLDLLDLIPCKIDPTITPFSYTTIFTNNIELPSSENKIDLNLLDKLF